MEHPITTSNSLTSAGSEGKLKRKKWRKKGESGAIYNSAMYFTAHDQFGLNFMPTLSDKISVKDGNKKKEPAEVENISIQSLLDLLDLVFEQDGVDTTHSTKHFEITNKGYLRYIVILCTFASASEPAAPLSLNHNGLTWRPVRLSKQVHRLVLASERLLFGSKPRKVTASNEAPDCYLEGPIDNNILASAECQLLLQEFSGDSEVTAVWKKLKPLCINAGTRHLLGYPTLATSTLPPASTGNIVTGDTSEIDDEQEAKRRRVVVDQAVNDDSILTHRLQLPTIDQARSLLSQCSTYSDGGVPFYSTLSLSFIEAMRSSPSNVSWIPGKITAVAAIDCEMVGTIHGRDEVVRITLLDHKGRVLIEEMVYPACGLEAVNDYRTAFTGLTRVSFAELIESGKVVDFLQVQALLLSLLSSESLMIGHSLDSDLRALRISHTCCVDTAALYPHPAGPLPMRQALRTLTLKYLGRAIQQQKKKRGAVGHDSAEDAQAALELALMKADGNGNDDNECDNEDGMMDDEQEEGYGDQKGDGLMRTIVNRISKASDDSKSLTAVSQLPAAMLLSVSTVGSATRLDSITLNNHGTSSDFANIPDWVALSSVEEAMDKMNSFVYSGFDLDCSSPNQGMRLCVLQVEEGNEVNNEEIERILLQRLFHHHSSSASTTSTIASSIRPAGLLLRLRQPSTIAARDMLHRQRQARKASQSHYHSMAVGSSVSQAQAVWGGHDERRLRELLKLVHTAAFNMTVI